MPVILVNIDCVTGNCDKMFSPSKSQGGGGRCAFYPHLIFQYQRVTFLNYPIFPETDVSDSRLELSL